MSCVQLMTLYPALFCLAENSLAIFMRALAIGKFNIYKAKFDHGAPFKSEQNVYFIPKLLIKLTLPCPFPRSIHSSH